MRCSCPVCGDWMIHSEAASACVCPTCLRRCSACLGTDSLLTREAIAALRAGRNPQEEREIQKDMRGFAPGERAEDEETWI